MEASRVLDPCITVLDRALRALFAPAHGTRPVPGSAPGTEARQEELSATDRHRAAGLMRVNHAGEIAAQALYHGQALVARTEGTRGMLLHAAREERDHLAWCEKRLSELKSRPSVLNPLWYAGSFALGAFAGLLGDRVSLGFVVETEKQVEGHLGSHLGSLPGADLRSRAIVEAMQADEITHGAHAKAAGGMDLPAPVRHLMRRAARIMTDTAYWI